MDKTGDRRSSPFGEDTSQAQASIEDFSVKIRQVRKALTTPDFMIIVPMESLILGKGMEETPLVPPPTATLPWRNWADIG